MQFGKKIYHFLLRFYCTRDLKYSHIEPRKEKKKKSSKINERSVEETEDSKNASGKVPRAKTIENLGKNKIDFDLNGFGL